MAYQVQRKGSSINSNGGDGLLSTLKAFDAFPKQRDEAAEFFQRSVSGGVITLVAGFLMTILFFSELGVFLKVRTVNELFVDTTRGEQMQIHFEVTFPAMPCSWMSVDAMDVSGEVHLDVDHDVYKQRLDPGGRPLEEHDPVKHEVGPSASVSNKAGDAALPCLSCYGAEDEEHKCCNTCSEVHEAYRKKGWALNDAVEQCKGEGYLEEIKAQAGEGCRLWGHMSINKVAGNIHFAPGRSFQQGGMHIHDLAPFAGQAMDLSHTITKLAFGMEYPGMRNPLDGAQVQQHLRNLHNPDAGSAPQGGIYQYFLKVVPTTYVTLANSTIASNQFSVTEHFREPQAGLAQLPGVFFFYDLSPIKVRFQEERRSLLTFLTSACAIVGGVFTVSGIIDSTVWAGQRAAKKKRELGKFI